MAGTGRAKLGGAAFSVAIAVIFAWLVLLTWLVVHVDAKEIEWSRLLVVLGSLEAVAFAAAGAIFGTTVQRQRVRDAHERADKAEGRATEAEKTAASKSDAAANGRALAAAVKISGGVRKATAGLERMSADQAPASRDELVELANKLFPD